MFAHEVIEDLKKHRNKFKSIVEPEFISSAINMIKSSHKFHYTSGDDLVMLSKGNWGKPILFDIDKHLLPYNLMWLDYKNTDKSGATDGKYFSDKTGMLISKDPDNDRFAVYFFYHVTTKEITTWSFSVSFNLVRYGDKTFGVSAVSEKVSKEIREMVEIEARENSREIGCLNIFLELLNCRNIITENIDPPNRINKKRKKRGKQPLFTYKTLIIDNGRHKKNGIENKTDITNRIHLCRGHFKEYTQENKLFGKYMGRYWWQPHVRGGNKDGIVVKDYKLKI